MAKVSQQLNAFNSQQEIQLRQLLSATQADLAALRASIVGITAQLDADAGVTDTTYASGNDPAALTLEA